MHAVRKEYTNDTLLVGATVHLSLIDVLLHFRFDLIAPHHRCQQNVFSCGDLHRFVWRSSSDDSLLDYRMTSSFAANMADKQNALDHALEYPQATEVVKTSFYVDVQEAIELQR